MFPALAKAFAKKLPLYGWQCLSLAFTGALLLIFPRVYLENDDIGFSYLLSHGLYAPWLSKPFCWLLIQLYTAFPAVAWYGVLQYLLLALLVGGFLKVTDDWAVEQALSTRIRCWLTVAILVLAYPFILRITFTCTSILMGGISILLMLASWRQGQPSGSRRQYIGSVLGYGILLCLCYLIRPEGIGAMAFLLPVILAAAYQGRRWLFSRLGLVSGLIFLLPLCVAVWTDQQLMRYPRDQMPYLTYVVRSNNMFGFGYTEQFKKHPEWLHQLGWSRNDYGMLERFLYWDEQVFSLVQIDKLAQRAPEAVMDRLKDLLKPNILFFRLYTTLIKTWVTNYAFTLYCVGLFILFSWMATTRWHRVFPFWFLGFVFVGTTLMQYVMRFPYRVACPTIILVTLSLLTLPGYDASRLFNQSGKLKRSSAVILLFCAMALFIFNGPFRVIRTALLPLSQTRTKLEELNRLMTDHYLLREAGVIQISASDPLNPVPLKAPDIGPGWLIRSIPYYQRLRQFGLRDGASLISASVNNPKILYFFKDKNLPVLQDFIVQHDLGGCPQCALRFVPEEKLVMKTFHQKSHLYRLCSYADR